MQRFCRNISKTIHSQIAIKDCLSTSMDEWRKNHNQNVRDIDNQNLTNQKIETEKDMAVPIEIESNVCFTLKTDAGKLSYIQNENGTYTDFIRVVIDMMLAFNGSNIDPILKKIIKKALSAYEEGDISFFDNEDMDFVQEALQSAQLQSQQYDEAHKYITSFSSKDKLTLRILSTDISNSQLEKILNKYTDFPPNIIHGIMHKHNFFELPFEKAAELYTQLRMLDVIISVNSNGSAKDNKSNKLKKMAARSSSKPRILTGKEKLASKDGVISL